MKIRVAVCRSALKLEEFLNKNVLAENIIQITHCINGSGVYAVELYTVIYRSRF